MRPYLDLMREILDRGEERFDRTGTGTLGLFGRQMRFDLAKGFPLVTTKRCHVRSIIAELLWFLRGDTNTAFLHDHGVTIWDEWADDRGDLGPVYGHQWRSWGGNWTSSGSPAAPSTGRPIDQISNAIKQIREDPRSRRIIVSSWNVSDLDRMALPPCHAMFQFYVHGDGRLSLQLYQRSADFFLGVPFNIAGYALLTMMAACVTGLRPGDFVHTFGDVHLYRNHIEQARLQLSREPRPLPTMRLNPSVRSIFDFRLEDFTLEGYDPHSAIKADISV